MFYRRVFTPLDPALKMAICFGFFVTLSYPLTIWVTMANCCRPVSYFWNKFSGAKGTCINVNQFVLALGIINMLNDFIVLLIPFPRIVTLQMSVRKKVAICGIMAVGVLYAPQTRSIDSSALTSLQTIQCLRRQHCPHPLPLPLHSRNRRHLANGPRIHLVHHRALRRNRLRLSTALSTPRPASPRVRSY